MKVLYFYKPKNPECMSTTKHLEKVLEQLGLECIRYDMDTSDGKEQGKAYNILLYPTIILLDDKGKVYNRSAGIAMREEKLKQLLRV